MAQERYRQTTVTFKKSFFFTGVGKKLPAGTYDVNIYEVPMAGSWIVMDYRIDVPEGTASVAPSEYEKALIDDRE